MVRDIGIVDDSDSDSPVYYQKLTFISLYNAAA